ncbi:nitrile hydratase accessory protein [Rhizobiales bacterium]|uniref:nitrile hydratase accessory protein n=1 Tax=Hongsoonwoonella zoysiae TaxID=2821844 RepID=UPI00155F9BA3|nr:nitrile hydratase accessory protein [Hongsoonwoonella zoysiae]NRG16243.1 nitrile hydratase accessory protein [Hongsoonwoonella zoysiae]
MQNLEQSYIDTLNGSVAEPPRRCDRLTFDEPWQSRAFGMVLALSEDKVFDYEDFRQSLIATISDWEKGHSVDDQSWEYYEQWLRAFERLAVSRGLVSAEEIDRRTEEFRNKTRTESF